MKRKQRTSLITNTGELTSSCLNIRWNTPSRVWYITSWCLGIRWNTPRVWYTTSQCLDIRWNTPSRVWHNSSRFLDIRWNTPPRAFDRLILNFWISDETPLNIGRQTQLCLENKLHQIKRTNLTVLVYPLLAVPRDTHQRLPDLNHQWLCH